MNLAIQIGAFRQVQVAAGLGVEGVFLWGSSADYQTRADCAMLETEIVGWAGVMYRGGPVRAFDPLPLSAHPRATHPAAICDLQP